MSKEFDYVAFAREFEATNGRPPTADELDNAQWEHFEMAYTRRITSRMGTY